jgi:hypothetical protein
MATLWIREYQERGVSRGGREIQTAQEPGTDQAPLTFTTSAQSAAFATGTRFIAFYSSADFHYVVGANPTATTNALKLAAGVLYYVGVTEGHKIAAIVAS